LKLSCPFEWRPTTPPAASDVVLLKEEEERDRPADAGAGCIPSLSLFEGGDCS